MNIYKIKIGDVITPGLGWKLCNHFGFEYLTDRLEQNPQLYKAFKFDGASCLYDKPVATIFGMNPAKFTYLAALPHDLCYAYGKLGDDKEKENVDLEFRYNLIHRCGLSKFWSFIFYSAVKVGGVQILNTSFTWGFANRKRFHF